jgi:uncharacterized protein YlaI
MAGECRKKKEYSMNENFWAESISKLADGFIKNTDEFSPKQTYPCPACHNKLKIQIGRYQRINTKMIGITVECDICDKAISIDFIEE